MRNLILILVVLLCSCQEKTEKEKLPVDNNAQQGIDIVVDGTEDGKTTVNGDVLQLKSADLLRQSIYQTLGRGKTLKVSERGLTSDITDEFSGNFGGTSGLRFGEIYADSPSTSYLLALAVVADHAANRCVEDKSEVLCQCDTEESAQKMLNRALPFFDTSLPESQAIVKTFRDACLADQTAALTSLLGSLAFAARI